MSRKSKNTELLYFEDGTSCAYVPLLNGYFYKGEYYSLTNCFKALLKDKEISIYSFPNGIWRFRGTLYASLKELYEWEENNISMTYSQFKKYYKECGVQHSPTSCTLYSYDRNDENELFDSREEVIDELAYDMGNYHFLANVEEYEERYLDTLSNEECISYLRKSIKERIEILNNWKGEQK